MTPSCDLIVALDVPNSSAIGPIVDSLPEELRFYKVGLELFCAEGPAALAPLVARNARVFLDLKLHDIPNTVARAVRTAARHQVDLITVHASGGRDMLQAAANAAREFGDQRPRLVAVTTLTSLDGKDLTDLGIQRDLKSQALALTTLAVEAGIDGVVTSVHEVRTLREAFGSSLILVTPGIRMPSDDLGDQKRAATPEAAVRAGSTYLVVGRAILAADDPHAAARRILADMKGPMI